MKHVLLAPVIRTPAFLAVAGLIFASALTSARAASDVHGWKSEYVDPGGGAACGNDAREMAQCAGRNMEHSGKFLRRVIAELRKSLDPEQVKPFAASNDLWFRFRDASCTFDAATAGGSSQAMRYGECVHTYNVQRIHLLEKYHYCLTGGECPNDLHLYYLLGE